jgi:hypothetical protein
MSSLEELGSEDIQLGILDGLRSVQPQLDLCS